MNDRFKFRVWNKEQNRFHLDISCDITAHGTLVLSQGIKGKEYIIDDDNYVIQQCTGLKDKNGKLIYEGDICKYKFEEIGEQKAIIYFNKELCSFLAKPLNDFQYTKINNCEVIGNIYENKELLNE